VQEECTGRDFGWYAFPPPGYTKDPEGEREPCTGPRPRYPHDGRVGRHDASRVPLSTSRTLRRDHPKLDHLHVITGAGHVEAWNQDPTAYDQALRAFLR